MFISICYWYPCGCCIFSRRKRWVGKRRPRPNWRGVRGRQMAIRRRMDVQTFDPSKLVIIKPFANQVHSISANTAKGRAEHIDTNERHMLVLEPKHTEMDPVWMNPDIF